MIIKSLNDLLLIAFSTDLLLIVCAGSQCSVEASTNEGFVEGCDVPSIILSAFQSAERRRQRSSNSDSDSCDICQQPATVSVEASHRQQLSSSDDQQCGLCSEQHNSDVRSSTSRHWRPLLVVIPLRLGLSEINPIYFSAIKVMMNSYHVVQACYRVTLSL